jgi:hypothetical protein
VKTNENGITGCRETIDRTGAAFVTSVPQREPWVKPKLERLNLKDALTGAHGGSDDSTTGSTS